MEWNIYDMDDSTMLGSHTMNACPTTVINEIEEKTNSVYPNPAINTINFDNLNKIDEIEIIDALGNTVTTISVTSDKASIDIACFISGLYIARLKSNNEIKSIKFIKK
jgi:hypothetical protein